MTRAQRMLRLREAERRGIAPTAIWLRYLSRQGLDVERRPLRAIALRHGMPPDVLHRCWERRLISIVHDAHVREGGDPGSAPSPGLVALATVRHGPREALLLLPEAQFAAALRSA